MFKIGFIQWRGNSKSTRDKHINARDWCTVSEGKIIAGKCANGFGGF